MRRKIGRDVLGKVNQDLATLITYRRKKLLSLLNYMFAEIDEKLIQDLYDSLHPVDGEKDYMQQIYMWLVSDEVKLSRSRYKYSYDEFLGKRADLIANVILNASFDIVELVLAGREVRILDIGSGDGAISERIGRALNARITTLDVSSNQTDIDWSIGNKSSAETDSPIKKRIVYDGVHLTEAVEAAGEDKYDVVMYNHSLHHFSSPYLQKESLKAAKKNLKSGGVLFLSEHDSCCDDDVLDLIHVLFVIRANIRNGRIATYNDLPIVISNFEATSGQTHYFSKNMLDMIVSNDPSISADIVRKTKRELYGDPDISKSMYVGYSGKNIGGAREQGACSDSIANRGGYTSSSDSDNLSGFRDDIGKGRTFADYMYFVRSAKKAPLMIS